MDKLKNICSVTKRSSTLDAPADDTWESIESKMSVVPKTRHSTRIVRFAAAACLIALAGVGLWLVIKDRKTQIDTAKQSNPLFRRWKAQGRNPPANTIHHNNPKPKQKTRSQDPSMNPPRSPSSIKAMQPSSNTSFKNYALPPSTLKTEIISPFTCGSSNKWIRTSRQ